MDIPGDNDKVKLIRTVNASSTQNIANTCKAANCKMLYLSTDYVFGDQRTEPWESECKDYKLLNVYGQMNLEGEVSQILEKCFIIRIT